MERRIARTPNAGVRLPQRPRAEELFVKGSHHRLLAVSQSRRVSRRQMFLAEQSVLESDLRVVTGVGSVVAVGVAATDRHHRHCCYCKHSNYKDRHETTEDARGCQI